MGHKQQNFCQTDIAQHCIDDLRNNRGNNIHPFCNYSVDKVYCNASTNYIEDDGEVDDFKGSCWTETKYKNGMQLLGTIKNVEKWGDCCPILDGSADDFLSSSAYPDALLCLKNAYCENERVYTDLVNECEERCCADGECYHTVGDDDEATATGLTGTLLDAYASYSRTEGGPCAPSTPSSAFRTQPLGLAALVSLTLTVSMILR
mmetsp:Transcript_26018/g.33820  ORF Transcript_26018/g.33820 Transcript_26018/m.33820 type:complete len:205 (-) Transcript_26018:108-722(-)